jgi:hypothetical protein
MVDVSMLKSLKMMEEVVNDVTTTEEVVADSEATEIQVENVGVQVVAVSDQEKKVDLEVIEIVLLEPNVQKDQEEKAVLVAMQLQKENQVHFKEKKEHLEDLEELVTDQREDLLMMLKQEDLEKANNSFEFMVLSLRLKS